MRSELETAVVTLIVALCAAPAALGQAGGGFDLSWNTFDGGGARSSTGGGYELGATIGQPDTSPTVISGGGFSLTGGFWGLIPPPCTTFAPADFNQDCSVDATDFAIFKACVSGPNVPYNPAALPPGCTLAPDAQEHIAADFNHDGDVDQDDYGIFQRCFSGPGRLPDPSCAG
jgi:hypothetical protein